MAIKRSALNENRLYNNFGHTDFSGRIFRHHKNFVNEARCRVFWPVWFFQYDPDDLRNCAGEWRILTTVQQNKIRWSCNRGEHVPCFSRGIADGREHVRKHDHHCYDTALGRGYEAELEGCVIQAVGPLSAQLVWKLG